MQNGDPIAQSRCSSSRGDWAIKGQHGAVMPFQLWPIHHLSPAFSLGQLGLRSGLEKTCTRMSGTETKISARYHNSQIGHKGNLHPVYDLRGFVPSFSLLRDPCHHLSKRVCRTNDGSPVAFKFRFPNSRTQRSCPP